MFNVIVILAVLFIMLQQQQQQQKIFNFVMYVCMKRLILRNNFIFMKAKSY